MRTWVLNIVMNANRWWWLALCCCCSLAQARHCELNGKEVNPDNGSTTAGQTGLLRCFRDDGQLWYEQALQDGEHLGLDRWHDSDGSVRERSVNAQGNSEGRARKWWPGGQLQVEGEYRNGRSVGLHRSWHRNGQLRSLSVHAQAGQVAMSLEWDDAGRLRELRCAEQSLDDADRIPCGHEGRHQTILHDGRGQVRERRVLQNVQVLSSEHYEADQLIATVEYDEQGRIETHYHPGGTPAQRDVVENGYRVLREQWFMNGARKARISVEPRDRDAKMLSESFRDDGTLAERVETLGNRTLRRASFDPNGSLAEDWEYAPEGHVSRHRKYTPAGDLLLDEALYADGSRKLLKVEATDDY